MRAMSHTSVTAIALVLLAAASGAGFASDRTVGEVGEVDLPLVAARRFFVAVARGEAIAPEELPEELRAFAGSEAWLRDHARIGPLAVVRETRAPRDRAVTRPAARDVERPRRPTVGPPARTDGVASTAAWRRSSARAEAPSHQPVLSPLADHYGIGLAEDGQDHVHLVLAANHA
jgi:hypothetical protein